MAGEGRTITLDGTQIPEEFQKELDGMKPGEEKKSSGLTAIPMATRFTHMTMTSRSNLLLIKGCYARADR